MSVIDLLLAAGIAAALVSLCTGNVTAAALLGSWALSSLMCASGAQFYAPAWILWDVGIIAVCVAAAVLWAKSLRIADGAALLLFLPIWALYFEDGLWAIDAGNALIAGQMLLMFPPAVAKAALRKFDHFFRHYDPWDDFLKATA